MAEKSGLVPGTDNLANVVSQAFWHHGGLANPSEKALQHLSNLEKKLASAPGKKMPYSEVMREVQALKHKADDALRGATPDGDLAETLLDTREVIINHLDQISPMYRQANRLYRQEQATIDVMNAVRAGTPGTSLDKFIENNRDVIKAFSPAAVKEISAIANRLNTVASSVPAGGYRQTFSALMEMIGAHGLIASETGRAVIRKALSNTPDKIPSALSASIQLWRAGNSATSDY
jgi:predicted RNA-binding Zn ribbon-like protein